MTTGHKATAAGQDTDLQARLSRARGFLAPRPDPALESAVRLSVLALDPVAAEQAERDARWLASYGEKKKRDGRCTGWKKGPPRCPSCDEFLQGHGGWCAQCQTFNGHHDHGR